MSDAAPGLDISREALEWLRPDVVWFGEPLPPAPMRAALEAAQACDVCLVIGTFALVYPAAHLPQMARLRGAYLIEINPEATNMTQLAEWSAQYPAGVALLALLSALNEAACAQSP